jgi:hypothetical protein
MAHNRDASLNAGGASAALIPSLLAAGGAAASGISSSMAHNRDASLNAGLTADKQFEEELANRMAFNQQSRGTDTRNSLLLQGALDHQNNQLPGYLTADNSALTGDTRESAMAQLLAAQQRLSAGNAMPLPKDLAMRDPRLLADEKSKSSIWEKILGGAGLAASAYGNFYKPNGGGSMDGV